MQSGKLAPFLSYSSLKVPLWYKDYSLLLLFFSLPFNFPDLNVQFGWSQETDHTLQNGKHTQGY